MQKCVTQYPTDDELSQFAIRSYKGIEVGLGQDDPMASVARGCGMVLTLAYRKGYASLTAEKKVVWIGVRRNPVAKAATRKDCGFFNSCPSMAARWESREARRFLLRRVPGTPILSSCLPDWRRGGSYSTAPMESIMLSTQGTSVPSIFSFQSCDVRTFTFGDAAWFAAADVCGVLHIKNHRDSLTHLDADEKGVVSTDTPGGQQKISVVNESGLYALVLRSRKPEARKFAKWVTSEVLPVIRKTGAYQGVQNSDAPRGDLNDPAYNRASRDELYRFVDSLPPGIAWPNDPATRQRIADGYLSDMLLGRRWLVSFDPRGRMQFGAIPHDASIITMDEVAEFIREARSTDQAALMEILLACADRLGKVRR